MMHTTRNFRKGMTHYIHLSKDVPTQHDTQNEEKRMMKEQKQKKNEHGLVKF